MNLVTYRFLYFFRVALKNIRHSPFLTAVSICTIAVSLILIGFFGHILLNTYNLLDDMGSELQVTVYLRDDVQANQAEAIRQMALARPDVQEVTILSPKEDRDRNRALLDDALLAGLDPESVPGNLCMDIVLKQQRRVRQDFDELATWLSELKAVDQVDDIHYTAQKFRVLYSRIDIMELGGLISCGVILFAAIFFIFSTIKLAVYARHEEIEVLKLVGATDRFIRAPFYIEGVLQGLLGAFVALAAVGLIHLRIQRAIHVEQGLNFELDLLPGSMIVWFLVGGVLLGFLGSAFSVGRHLKV